MNRVTLFLIPVLFAYATLAGVISEQQPGISSNRAKEAQLRASIESNETVDVIKLIEDGVNLNFKYEDGKTPIHLAVINGDLDIIKVLVKNGAEVNERDNLSRTALQLAAVIARPDIINVLVENGATVKDSLFFAVKSGDLEVIKLLIEHGANVNDNQTLLHYAIVEGRPDVVKILLQNGANVNVKGRNKQTPLHLATLRGDMEIVKIILDHGVEKIDDIDKEGNTALLYASSSGNREMSKLLIEKGANMFATNWGQFIFYKWAEEDKFFLDHLDKRLCGISGCSSRP